MTQVLRLLVIISETLARRIFPNQDAITRLVYRTDPVLQFILGLSTAPHRIIGVNAHTDDVNFAPEPTLTVYSRADAGRTSIVHHYAGCDVASVLPAARAARIDGTQALRSE